MVLAWKNVIFHPLFNVDSANLGRRIARALWFETENIFLIPGSDSGSVGIVPP